MFFHKNPIQNSHLTTCFLISPKFSCMKKQKLQTYSWRTRPSMPLTPCHWLHLQSYLQPSPLRPPRLSPDPRGSLAACSWIELPSPATGTPETPQRRSTRWKLRGYLVCESKHSFNARSHSPTHTSIWNTLRFQFIQVSWSICMVWMIQIFSVFYFEVNIQGFSNLSNGQCIEWCTDGSQIKKTGVLLGLHGCCSAPCHRFFKGGQGTRCSREGTDVIQASRVATSLVSK